MKKKKLVFKRMLGLSLASVIALGSFSSVNPVLANNYTDTAFGYNYSGDGTDMSTPTRSKQDSSATYVFNNASNSANINVYVVGTNTYSTDPTSIIQYGYYTSPVVLKTGYRKYIKNSIHPTYKYAYLCMSTQDGRAHYISGKWSPDNCSGY